MGRVGARGVAEIVHDTSKDPDYVVDDAVRGSEMAVPILCDGEVIGVIDSEHTMPGFSGLMKVLQNVANICGQGWAEAWVKSASPSSPGSSKSTPIR